MNKKIVILGAGPCGLGAGWRLTELGHSHFLILESCSNPGGLASTETDDAGFLWDMGGHVIFSHYKYFHDLLSVINENWCYHKTEAFVWMKGRFIPYPLQNNIHYLPETELQQCLDGLSEAERQKNVEPKNFDEWLEKSFGTGLSNIFLRPYNKKVWGVDPVEMNARWVGKRVSTVTLASVLSKKEKEDNNWGPNNYFYYPMYGGTGAVWLSLANRISDDKFMCDCKVVEVDSDSKILTLHNGTKIQYDVLVSTIPLNRLCTIVQGIEGLKEKAPLFRHSSTHIVGLGFSGEMPSQFIGKSWMYFPEDNCVFYRVTVFSNYSPYNVPLPGQQWSLMFEVVESNTTALIIDEVIAGAVRSGLLTNADCESIVSQYHK